MRQTIKKANEPMARPRRSQAIPHKPGMTRARLARVSRRIAGPAAVAIAAVLATNTLMNTLSSEGGEAEADSAPFDTQDVVPQDEQQLNYIDRNTKTASASQEMNRATRTRQASAEATVAAQHELTSQGLTARHEGVPKDVAQPLSKASYVTGFPYRGLVAIADAESLQWDIESSNHQSTAQGLLQMTRQYFLEHVYLHRDFLNQNGYSDITAMIKNDERALKPGVAPEDFYEHRNDPLLSALIVAKTLIDEAEEVKNITGKQPKTADMYALHFLGKQTGKAFLDYYYSHPQYRHHNILDMPFISEGAIERNQNIFFRYIAPEIKNDGLSCLTQYKRGNREQCQPRSLGDLYQVFKDKTGPQITIAPDGSPEKVIARKTAPQT